MHHARRLLLLISLALSALLHAAQPEEMITHVFRLPSIYPSPQLSCVGPFPAPPPSPFVPRTAKEILKAHGVKFGDGASASFDPTTELLTVHNTQPNLDKAEIFVSMMTSSARSVAYTLTLIEGPGELIRQTNAAASRTSNAAQQLALLLDHAKNPDSNVHVVGDAFVEAKSDLRATSQAVLEYSTCCDFKMDAKSRSSAIQEMHPIGLIFEIEPKIDPNGITLDSTCSIQFHPAPPRARQVTITEPITGHAAEFPTTVISEAHFVTNLTTTSGQTKLLGVAKPFGTKSQQEDVLWAAFVTGTVRTLQQFPNPKPAASPQAPPPPPGMTSASFFVPEGLFETERFYPDIQPFRPKSRRESLLDWFTSLGIVPTAGAVADHYNGVLRVINTPDNIERISALIDQCLGEIPNSLTFTLHTIEAPAAFLRDLTHKAAPHSDQHDMWAAVEAAVSRGDARFINTAFLETKSGTRATHQSVRAHSYLSAYSTDAKGFPKLGFEVREIGSSLEIEPNVGGDDHTVDLTFVYELNPAAPEQRRAHFQDPASQKPFEMPVTSFHSLKTTTSLSMTKSGLKLISLNRPTGRSDADVLWATFLKCDLVPQIAKPHPIAIQPAKDPKTWLTHTFPVTPDFLSSSSAVLGLPMQRTARMIFEGWGISFPDGAYASHDPVASTITVKNTNENLIMVEDYVASITKAAPKTVAITTHIIQAPGPLLRRLVHQASGKTDHRAELDEVLAAVKAGTAQHLSNARIETKSGTRATSHQGHEHTSIYDVRISDKGEPSFMQDTRNIGFNLELEPYIHKGGELLGLSITTEFHTAPPLEHREHLTDTQGRRLEFPLTDYFTSKITTGITIPDGTTRLLSLSKPTGKPEFEKQDILQAIFITCDILRTEK